MNPTVKLLAAASALLLASCAVAPERPSFAEASDKCELGSVYATPGLDSAPPYGRSQREILAWATRTAQDKRAIYRHCMQDNGFLLAY